LFSRDILNDLDAWADLEGRKPLVLRGARQVGKTTAVELFSAGFDQFLKLDLEHASDRSLFERDLAPGDLMQAIRLHLNAPSRPGRTLLFLDEIQMCPQAIRQMRYFHEDAPRDLHVIAAGSLLETLIARGEVSFPVGRVEYRFMFPLSFAESLGARGRADLRECLESTPVPAHAHDILLREFRRYTFIGGMPEVVAAHARTGDVASLSRLYDGLMLSLRDDVEKYARSEAGARVLRHAIQALPFEAGRRIKFEGFGNGNYRSREMGEALRMLERAMLIHLVHPTTRTRLPLTPNRRRAPRLQFLDSGMLCHAVGLQPALFEETGLDDVYNGILAEHVVAQELTARSGGRPAPVFWVRESPQANAEVDFLLTSGSRVVPVEVKSGRSGSLRSLQEFVDRSDAEVAVRLYSGEADTREVRTSGRKPYTLISLPLYLAARLPGYLSALEPGLCP
jgi:hypothetical protein